MIILLKLWLVPLIALIGLSICVASWLILRLAIEDARRGWWGCAISEIMWAWLLSGVGLGGCGMMVYIALTAIK